MFKTHQNRQRFSSDDTEHNQSLLTVPLHGILVLGYEVMTVRTNVMERFYKFGTVQRCSQMPAHWWGSSLVSVTLSNIHLLCPFHASSPPDLMALALWTRNMKGESISYPDSSAVAGEPLANRDCSAPGCPAVVICVTSPTNLWLKQLNLSV